MRVEIINTGTELLLGRVANTHPGFLAQSLLGLGLRVERQATVPDGVAIAEALREAMARADLIIVTGGLGPTSDDITREAAAAAFGRKLIFHQEILDGIAAKFAKRKIAMNDLQVAQDTEDKAKVAVETAAEHLRLLGNDPDKMNFMVDIFAPVSGVITDQEVASGSLVQAYSTPYPFTISDLSTIWIVCDVYENDMSFVRLGEYADIHVSAYPNTVLKGRISNIGAIMDPNLRTAKVRLEVANSGILRLGMFVTATFHGQQSVTRSAVPATAILHLHDRDWVYVPVEDGQFKRVAVVGGKMLPDNLQEVTGIDPGQKVVQNALALQATVEQVAQ